MFGMKPPQTSTPIVTPIRLMQESVDPAEWREVPSDESLRQVLGPNDPPSLKRKLYPFSARLLKPMMGLQEGTIFAYARTKLEPAVYPIVVYITVNGGSRTTHYNSNEVELIEPRELS